MGPKSNEKAIKPVKVVLDSLEPSQTQKKATRIAQNRAIEEQRLRDRDSMMDMSECSNFEYETIEDIKSKFATDKFGNTISKAKASEDAKVEQLRAAAKARRAEKEAAAAAAATLVSLDDSAVSLKDISLESKVKSSKDLNIDEVRAKAEAGGKLTHKEKKMLGSFQKASVEEAQLSTEAKSGLSSFSISMQAQGTGGGKN